MGSLTFSEMLTIAVVVLIVFGPKRLPELARKAGAMLARVRKATKEIRDELQTEYRDALEPLQELRADLEEARRDLRMARDELAQAATDVSNDVERVQRDISATVRDGSSSSEAAATTGDRAEPDGDKAVSPGGPTDLRASGGARGGERPPPGEPEVASRSMSGLAPLDAVREELKAAREALAAEATADPVGGPVADEETDAGGAAELEAADVVPADEPSSTDVPDEVNP